MEINVEINERTLSLIRSYAKKDVTSIVNEALVKWTHENMFRCPLDENFCSFSEPCNSCPKSKKEMDMKIRK
jgi:hypothetical protein